MRPIYICVVALLLCGACVSHRSNQQQSQECQSRTSLSHIACDSTVRFARVELAQPEIIITHTDSSSRVVTVRARSAVVEVAESVAVCVSMHSEASDSVAVSAASNVAVSSRRSPALGLVGCVAFILMLFTVLKAVRNRRP